MISQKVKEVVYNISSSFEGKGYAQVTGNFDKQGLSFGFLQWCLGQGSLQPIWKEALEEYDPESCIFTDPQLSVLLRVMKLSRVEQVAWADSISMPAPKKSRIVPEWRKTLEAWGEATADIQMRHAQDRLDKAVKYCNAFGLKSIRALSFMFDICVQNGSIRQGIIDSVKERVNNEKHHSETSTLLLILEQRLDDCNPRWREDVKARKECIIYGSGEVHGKLVNLDKEYGLSDNEFNS